MSVDKNKLQRQIENIDLCIWLFSRYNDETSRKLIEEYYRKKEMLQKQLLDISLFNNEK